MRINGQWLTCPDGDVRPVVIAELLAGDGTWRENTFMLDTGADHTVFTAQVLADLKLPAVAAVPLTGVGGAAASVGLTTKLRMTRDDGGYFTIGGAFSAFTDPAALEMSVLGRNVLNLFAVIVDRPGNIVCLLAQRHQYAVVVV